MMDAFLGLLYVISFVIALFAVYVAARILVDFENAGPYKHFWCILAALYWPLTILVTMVWLAWKGIVKGSKLASEKVEEEINEYREAWDATRQ